MQFAERISDAFREWGIVSNPAKLENAFMRGLPEESWEHTLQHICHLSLADRSIIIMVRNIALSEGIDQRAVLCSQIATATPASSRKVSKKKPPHPRKDPVLLLHTSRRHVASALSTVEAEVLLGARGGERSAPRSTPNGGPLCCC